MNTAPQTITAADFERWESSLQPGERSREDYEHEQRRKAREDAELAMDNGRLEGKY